MDPNQALSDARTALANMFADPDHSNAAQALADAFEALDGWLSNGGFLPTDWARKVWVVEEIGVDESWVIGVFSNQAAADATAAPVMGDVEEYEVRDEPLKQVTVYAADSRGARYSYERFPEDSYPTITETETFWRVRHTDDAWIDAEVLRRKG